ncbi:MAG: RluA family pseudouridine synthase [Fibrobacterota bacterium]
MTIKVTDLREDYRVDRYISGITEFSRTSVRSRIDEGLVFINQKKAKSNSLVKNGDIIEFEPPQPEIIKMEPENIPLDILYEDEDLIAVNKPPGLVVHPSPGHPDGTLANALLNYTDKLSGTAGRTKPGIVHRLDKDTSGVLMVAKNDRAHAAISSALSERKVEKHYLATAWGRPSADKGLIDAPLSRSKRNYRIIGVFSDGKPSLTSYELLEDFEWCSTLKLRLHTGRTHQARAHLRHTGCPILGDDSYGGRAAALKKCEPAFKKQATAVLRRTPRMMLHSWRTVIRHPGTGKELEIHAPVPDDMQKVIAEIKRLR